MSLHKTFACNPIDKLYITQRFGVNPLFYARYGLPGHNGLDFRTRFVDSPLGHRSIKTVWAGTVYEVRYDKVGYGYHVRIRHKDGFVTIYGHLKSIAVHNGQNVSAGAIVGVSDSTGDSTGPHLHLELREAGWEKKSAREYYGAINPEPFLLPEGTGVLDLDTEIDLELTKKMEGKLLLQVEERGELWLVSNGKRYYLGTTIYEYLDFMEKVRLGKISVTGIANTDIKKIPKG